jgi:beta-galactosidase/beta-glucuronidase
MPHAYPRPLLQRDEWTSLNGIWDFALDRRADWSAPCDVQWDRTIEVPFAPETARSGVHETGFTDACWYRRVLELPSLGEGECLMLRFGAVDYHADVWIDGQRIGEHEGGYTPFAFDIASYARMGSCEIVVRAYDPPGDLEQPRGKQDWEVEPHLIWYPRTSGIWQTVWLERLPSMFIESL